MSKPHSIKQNTDKDSLPNFRNIGIMFRILIICNALAVFEAFIFARNWQEFPENIIQIATLFTPVLMSSLLLLWGLQPWLHRLNYTQGSFVVHIIGISTTLLIFWFGGSLFDSFADQQTFNAMRYTIAALMTTSITLMYFRLRARLLSHALNEARLQMLRARIRPHFFFNSINAVLGIVRAHPKKAETALEDMADLFRMAMSNEEDMVPLSREIQLCNQYIALEKLRVEERLQVTWKIDLAPDLIIIPPLLLQPLIENAVYHGIGSLIEGGEVKIHLFQEGKSLVCCMENPCANSNYSKHPGNKMALQNIRERLSLLFDAESSYHAEHKGDSYRVVITLPYMEKN